MHAGSVCHGRFRHAAAAPRPPHPPSSGRHGHKPSQPSPIRRPAPQSSLPLFLGLAAAGGGLYYAKEQARVLTAVMAWLCSRKPGPACASCTGRNGCPILAAEQQSAPLDLQPSSLRPFVRHGAVAHLVVANLRVAPLPPPRRACWTRSWAPSPAPTAPPPPRSSLTTMRCVGTLGPSHVVVCPAPTPWPAVLPLQCMPPPHRHRACRPSGTAATCHAWVSLAMHVYPCTARLQVRSANEDGLARSEPQAFSPPMQTAHVLLMCSQWKPHVLALCAGAQGD